MPENELLIEIKTEEVPFLEHASTESAIKKMFDENELFKSSTQIFSSPTRLVVVLSGFANEVINLAKKMKGPAVNSAEIAVEGFLKKCETVKENLVEENGFFIYNAPEKRIPILEVVKNEIIPNLFAKILQSFSKTMVWNETRKHWIRPINNILIVLNGKAVEFEFAGISATNSTIINNKNFPVLNFASLQKLLFENNIILDFKARFEHIKREIEKIESGEHLKCVASDALFRENSYLSEYPEILLGTFDEKYLSLPEKVLILSLEKNQKYFLFKEEKTGKLSNFFAICINGKFEESVKKSIVEGNKKVLSARLEDAFYYIKIDTRFPLQSYLESLKNVTFHKNCGTVYERIGRMLSLLDDISFQINPDLMPNLKEIIVLSKADLQTEMVSSFTELQGYIGAFYAAKEGVKPEIAEAIANQYFLGTEKINGDFSKESLYFSLIEKYEKINSLIGAGEIPTSSRDPFGIRRDALAIVRILIEGQLDLKLKFEAKFKEIIFDRFEFYLKNHEKSVINFVLKAAKKEAEISFFKTYEKILKLEELSPKLEDYRRIFNILNSSEAREFKGFTVNEQLLSDFEKNLITHFSNELSVEELIQKKSLISEFFEKFMMLEKSDIEISKNRIAILELIEKRVVKFITY